MDQVVGPLENEGAKEKKENGGARCGVLAKAD